MSNTHELNSPSEVYFFSKRPEEYTSGNNNFSYEISRANEQMLESAKTKTLNSLRKRIIRFGQPTVDSQGKHYIYVVRSDASREDFQNVMSPEYLSTTKPNRGIGIRGLHYSASDRSGDAIGITVEADTPEAAKEQFWAWYAKIQAALKALEERFAVVNREIEQQVEKLIAQRRDELNRSKSAL